jgi:hypothetical protein
MTLYAFEKRQRSSLDGLLNEKQEKNNLISIPTKRQDFLLLMNQR